MSGREMFVFNPDLFVDDDEAYDQDEYVQDDRIDINVPHNIITVTETSITLTPKVFSENGERRYNEERSDGELSGDERVEDGREEERGENGKEKEEMDEETEEEMDEDQDNDKEKEKDLPDYVNESLFLEEEIPEDLDDN